MIADLSIEQRQLLSKKATELADSIEAGTYKGPTPTNSRGWCGCAAGILLAEAGMPVEPSEGNARWGGHDLGAYIDNLDGRFQRLTIITSAIDLRETDISALVEPYRRIASRLLEAP